MDKKVLIGAVFLLFLVAGLMFVSANLGQNNAEIVEEPEPTCGADTCGLECGGNCGIPSCGCGG